VSKGYGGDKCRAGVEHALQEQTDAGHCAFPRQGLVDRAAAMLEIPPDVVQAAVDHGMQTGRLAQGTLKAGHRSAFVDRRVDGVPRPVPGPYNVALFLETIPTCHS
jgi:hypothetical protein